MNLPLSGIRVLDLSRLLPGPYASLILADLGAEVIKVEDTQGGDYIRAMPPHVDGVGAWFASLNRNKRSVALDFKHAEGRAALLDLAAGADVVLESFRPGVLDKLGAGYEVMRARNPKLVYCAITGYGYDSPYRERAGHDLNYLAIAGVLGVNGSQRDGSPQLSGAQMADIAGGSLFAVISMLAALRVAERTGQGRFIDAAMTDGAMSLITMVLGADLAELRTGERTSLPPAPGTMQLNGRYLCYRIYEAADGYLSLGALEPKFWANFCQAIERPDLLSAQFDEAVEGNPNLVEVSEIVRTRTRAQWSELNARFDFCGEPILAFHEVPDNEHIRHRQLIFDLPVGRSVLPQVAVPVRFEGATRTRHVQPPLHGEATREMLGSAGWSEDRIAAALEQGAIR